MRLVNKHQAVWVLQPRSGAAPLAHIAHWRLLFTSNNWSGAILTGKEGLLVTIEKKGGEGWKGKINKCWLFLKAQFVKIISQLVG